MDSPDSVVRTPTPGPPTLSPLKRGASFQAEPTPEVLHAGKRLKDALLGDDDEDRGVGGSGEKGKELAKKDSIDSGPLSMKLEAQITCGICQDVFYRPVSIVPCLHTFCGSCIAGWFDKSSSCPTCRAEAQSTSDAHSTGALVELYLGLPGNEQEGRSVADKEKMDESYMPGQQLVKGRKQYAGHNEDGFYDEGEDEDEGDVDDDGEEEDWEFHRMDVHMPCPCCIQPNEHGFVCPVPTPNPGFDAAAAIPLYHPNPGHAACDNCGHSFPNSPDFGSSCTICRIFVCNGTLNPLCQSLRVVQELGNMDFNPLHGLPVGEILPSLFAGVATEQNILEGYLAETDGTVENLFEQLFHERAVPPRRPKFLGPALVDDKAVLELDDLVCRPCALAIFEAALEIEWPKMMKEPDVKDHLSPQVIARTDCWYGLGCRTAVHNPHHAQRLNHLCPATRATPPAAVPGARTIYHPQAGLIPPIDLTAVTFRDLNGSPAFFSTVVGEQEHGGNGNGGIEVLWEVEGEVKWVRTSRGEVPHGERPVEGGRDGDEELWHAAGWVKGVRVPGKTSREMGEARLSFGGKAWVVKDDYDLLCWV